MPPQDPYASLPEADPYASLPESAPPNTPAGKYDQYLNTPGKPKMLIRTPMANQDTAADVARGVAVGAAEGVGINAATNPRDVIEGTFKDLGKGVKDLLAETWEANAPKSQLGQQLDTPLSHATRTALDVIPTFIDQTATSLEQGGKDFYKAIQNKDWETAAQIAAKNAAMIATLKSAKEKGAAGANAVEDVNKPTLANKVQSLGRRVTEATQGAKDAVTKAVDQQTKALAENRQARIDTLAKNKVVTGKALQDIDQSKIDLADENQQIAAKNAQQAQAVARRGQLAKEVDQESVGVGKDINDLENKVYKQANAHFNDVRAKIGNVEAPPDHLIDTVKNAEQNILQGIPENVKEFRSITKLENTSEEMTQARKNVMAGQGMQGMDYNDLSPDRKALVDDIVDRVSGPVPASTPLTWDKLQSLKSRLDTRLRNGRGLNGDLKRALLSVRDGVVDEMGQMATANGAGNDWVQARDFWRGYKEDFHEPTGPSGSGSPVAKAKDAVDPDKIRRPFANTQSAIGNRGISILNKYPQFGGDQVANRVNAVLAKEQEMNALPDAVKAIPLKPPQEAFPMPERNLMPAIPAKPTVDISEVARKNIAQTAVRIGRINARDAGIIASSTIGGVASYALGLTGATHGASALIPVAMLSYEMGKYLMSNALDKPRIINWLAKTPLSELEALNKINGEGKINIKNGITEAAIQASGGSITLSPEIRQFLGPANVARITLANSGMQQGRKKPGQQMKDLQNIRSRSSNPGMPAGEEQ